MRRSMSGPVAAADREPFSGRRVLLVAGLLVLMGAGVECLRGAPASALSLTGSGVVAMINFHWLEGLLSRVIQPGSPRIDLGSAARFLLRLVLLGVVLAAVLWVPRVEPVAVVIGFSALVVALIAEGVRSGLQGGG